MHAPSRANPSLYWSQLGRLECIITCVAQVSFWQEVHVDGGEVQPVVIFATVTDRHEDNLAPKPAQNNTVPDRPSIGLK